MNFEIPLVIDENTLNLLPEYKNKYVKFLLFWLQEKNTKAVVIKSSWKKFNKEWDEKLKEAEEVKYSFKQFISGVVRPYRKEGFEDEVEDKNPINEIIKIVNRDYDIVEYLIVDNPSLYKNKSIKIAYDSIITLKDFYTLHEVANSEIFKLFLQNYNKD